jgi:hypothetical protein
VVLQRGATQKERYCSPSQLYVFGSCESTVSRGQGMNYRVLMCGVVCHRAVCLVLSSLKVP